MAVAISATSISKISVSSPDLLVSNDVNAYIEQIAVQDSRNEWGEVLRGRCNKRGYICIIGVDNLVHHLQGRQVCFPSRYAMNQIGHVHDHFKAMRAIKRCKLDWNPSFSIFLVPNKPERCIWSRMEPPQATYCTCLVHPVSRRSAATKALIAFLAT